MLARFAERYAGGLRFGTTRAVRVATKCRCLLRGSVQFFSVHPFGLDCHVIPNMVGSTCTIRRRVTSVFNENTFL